MFVQILYVWTNFIVLKSEVAIFKITDDKSLTN
jgi:hypothetical protein